MSELITPQLREDVLERLRAVTLARNFKKTPEEIERLILEKARGVKKTYLDLLSRVLNQTGVTGAPTGAHNASPISQPMPGGTVATHSQMAGIHMNQPQRPGQPIVQGSQPRIQHPLPVNVSIGGPGAMQPGTVTIQRPRMHSVSGQPNQPLSMQQQQQVYHSPGAQPIQPGQPLPIVGPTTRTLLAVSSTPNLNTQGMPVSSQSQQPLILYQQGSVPIGGPGDKPVIIRPLSTSMQQIPITGAQAVHHQGENFSNTAGGAPVMIRTSSSNSLPDESGGVLGKPVPTVLPMGQAKVVRPHLQSTVSKSGSGATQQSKVLLPATQASQSAPNVAALASKSHSSDRPTGQRTDSSGGRVGSATSKPGQEVHPPEVQAQIVSRLTAMAARYLPAVRLGIQMASAQPETQPFVRKYIKLRDILENPEANLNVIRLAQVQPIERLLVEIEQNPMHLAQQQQQHPSQQQQQQPKHAAAAAAAASAAAAAAATASTLQHKPAASESDSSRKSVPVQMVRHGTVASDQGRQQHKSAAGLHTQQGAVDQSQTRFRVPTTNLNTLLSQPLGSGSPTSMPEVGRNLSQASPNSRALFVSTSPDIGTTSIQNVSAPHTTTHLGAFPVDASGTRAGGLEGQFARTGHGVVGPFGLQPRTAGVGLSGLQTNLQTLAVELQKISERAAQDVCYGRRVCRAINEVSQETRLFRESFGLLLPQDLCPPDIVKSSKDEPFDKLEKIELQPVRSCSRKRERTFSDDEVHSKASVSSLPTGGPTKPPDQSDEPKGKKVCLDVFESGCKMESLSSEEQPLTTPNSEYTTHSLVLDPFPDASSNSLVLFTKVTVPYDPEADPLDKFSTDQIERLNSRILREIQRIRELHIRVEANPNPPSIDDMETYATCMDAGEWNTSCHLKLSQDDENLSYLPCAPPDLMVRLAPDYLKSGHLNWFYQRRSELLSLDDRSTSQYSTKECERFLDLCYAELDRTVQKQLRRITHYRLSLYMVAKTWMDCICAAMARFVKLDQNVFLGA